MLTEETLRAVEGARRGLDATLAAQDTRLVAVWAHAWDDVAAELDKVAAGDLTQKARAAQLVKSRNYAASRLLDAAETSGVTVADGARRLVEQSVTGQAAIIGAQLPNRYVALTRPPKAALDAITRRATQQITARTRALSEEATAAMRRSLVLGVAAGDNPVTTARRMIRRTEGVFNGGLTRAMVIARTETLDAHRAAAQAAQNANADVLAGWRWWAQLEPRTCLSCIAQHGKLFPLDDPGPLDHHQGRCARVPATKSWRELGFDLDETVPKVETGPQWFARQPEAIQLRMMGPARMEAWLAGDYPAEAWSIRRSTPGWRDSFHVSRPPRPGQSGPSLLDDLDDGPTPAAPAWSIDGLDDEAAEQLMFRLADEGDWAGSERVGELLDARTAAAARNVNPPPWRPDPDNPGDPRTFEWFETLDEDGQVAWLDLLDERGYMQAFTEEQWAYFNGREALEQVNNGRLGLSLREYNRRVRADWEAWIDNEWVNLENRFNGQTLRPAVRATRSTADLFRVNEQTARKWASEEVLRHWDETGGRMSFARFEAGWVGDSKAIKAHSEQVRYWA